MYSETNTPNYNSLTRGHEEKRGSKVKKVAATLTAVALLGAVGKGVKDNMGNADPFYTDIPVPTEAGSYKTYTINPGDTEESIAAQYGHAGDLNFENMLNSQLPETDQKSRTLRPGESLRIPPDK